MFLLAGSIFLLLSLVAGACIIHWGLLIVTVEHQSMHPTLQHGDRVLALRRGFRRWIRRGSIVLVTSPHDAELPEPPSLFIKRVVALGETTITLPLWHPNSPTPAHTVVQQPVLEEKTWHILRHHLFVCGDNRAGSVDSRACGPIPLSCIRGLILTRLRSASPRQSKVV